MDIKRSNLKISSNIKFTILAIVLIAVFCVALTPVSLQNDTFYTIKVGEHIANNGIDMQDPFSWHEGLAYTYPHWLYDLLTYFIYTGFGMDGIYICTCILSVILGLVIYMTNTKLTKNNIASFIITIGVMYVLKSYIAARAQLVTFILFALTVLFIEKFIETKNIKYAIGLIIIPILIANLHCAVFPFYFVLYLPYIAEYLLSEIFDCIIYSKIKIKLIKRKITKLENSNREAEKLNELKTKLKKLEEQISKIKIKREKDLQNPYKIKFEKKKNVKWLILIFIICIFTGLLTPLGKTPYTYLIDTMKGNTTQNINEHQPMLVTKDVDMSCIIVILGAILIFSKTKIRLCDVFMLGGLLYLAIDSKRQISIFAIIGSVILCRMIVELLDMNNKEKKERLTKALTSVIGIIVLSGIMLSLSYYFVKDKFDDEYISESSYPVKACDYIINNIDLNNSRFYNEYNYGSYMLYRGIPVFIDSRADLYDPVFSGLEDDIFMDFIETSNISKFYDDVFNKYNITHVICYDNSKLSMIIDKTNDDNYNELYRDDYFVIYKRLGNK